jgi:hypothetical protein
VAGIAISAKLLVNHPPANSSVKTQVSVKTIQSAFVGWWAGTAFG